MTSMTCLDVHARQMTDTELQSAVWVSGQEVLKAGELTGDIVGAGCRAVWELQFWCCRLLECPLVFFAYFLLLLRGKIVLQGNINNDKMQMLYIYTPTSNA